MSLLLLTALIAVCVCFILEKQTTERLTKQSQRLKRDLGYIEVDDASLIHIRQLHRESKDWAYRIYLPPEHGLKFELMLGGQDNPEVLEDLGDPPEGQFTMTLYEANSFLKPNHIPTQCFVVGCVKGDSEPNTITRHGKSWVMSKTEKYRASNGSYDNQAHQTSLEHGTVKTFEIDEEIPLMLILDQSDAGKKLPKAQRDRISIKLMQRDP